MKLSILSLAALAPLAAAHFELVYPTSRPQKIDTMMQFPCGNSDPTGERTKVSLSDGSFPVALSMGHSGTAVEMLLALGTDPGTNFNITLVPTFGVMGLGALCLPHVDFDSSILGTNVTDGMNATLQVQSNGDPQGGLYAVWLFSVPILLICTSANNPSAPISNSHPQLRKMIPHLARTTPVSPQVHSLENRPNLMRTSRLPRACRRMQPVVVGIPTTTVPRKILVLLLCRQLLGVCLVRLSLVVLHCCNILSASTLSTWNRFEIDHLKVAQITCHRMVSKSHLFNGTNFFRVHLC